MNTKQLKAFYGSDSDIYAATDEQQAAALYCEQTGDSCCDDGYPRELSDAELDEPHPEFDENEQRTGDWISIRQMLDEHGEEPGWLCGSVW